MVVELKNFIFMILMIFFMAWVSTTTALAGSVYIQNSSKYTAFIDYDRWVYYGMKANGYVFVDKNSKKYVDDIFSIGSIKVTILREGPRDVIEWIPTGPFLPHRRFNVFIYPNEEVRIGED